MCLPVMLGLLLLGPVLALATAALALGHHGPLGVLAALALVAAAAALSGAVTRRVWRWWRAPTLRDRAARKPNLVR